MQATANMALRPRSRVVILTVAVVLILGLGVAQSKNCHTIKSSQDLNEALAEIGWWEALCENLGVDKAILDNLRYAGLESEEKKRRCLQAFLDQGDTCWETVIRVVEGHPFYNKKLANRIAEQYSVVTPPAVKGENHSRKLGGDLVAYMATVICVVIGIGITVVVWRNWSTSGGATGFSQDWLPGKEPSGGKVLSKRKLHCHNPDRKIQVKLTFKHITIVRSSRPPSINDPYIMQHLPHGICVIINNKTFTDHEDRLGTDKDEKNLSKTFRYLGYDVEIYRDCKAREIKGIFQELHNRDAFEHHDSFVCCILSHGQDWRIFGSDSISVELDSITSLFTAKNCPKLKEKPKMFFIQACRGKVPTKVENKSDRGYVSDGDVLTRPEQADFFFGFATPPGYEAIRHMDRGSWYISELCEVFCTYATFTKLQDMHTKVTDNVCKKESDIGTKEAPEGQSRGLSKDVYFFNND